jgi:hypothetical protein
MNSSEGESGNSSDSSPVVRKSFRRRVSDLTSRLDVLKAQTSTLEGADPELALTFLQRGTSNLTTLKTKLSSCTDDWMLGFLDQGGLELLFARLVRLGERGFAKFADAIDQLTCVGCIRAVMNSKVGLDHLVDSRSQNYVTTLAEGGAIVLWTISGV